MSDQLTHDVPGDEPAIEPAATGGPSPWRTRDFRLVWGGGFVNDIGDWLLLVALPVYVFIESGSGSATAILFVVELVAALVLGPIGGSLVDRWDLRRTLIVTNLAQAVTLIPLLAVTGDRIWPAYLVVGAQAMLTQINNPASVALLPRVVSPDQLTVANAANSTSASLARLIGSPLGGLAVGLGGIEAVVVIDGLSFLVVAIAIAFVRADTAPITTDAETGEEVSTGVRAGVRAVVGHRSVAIADPRSTASDRSRRASSSCCSSCSSSTNSTEAASTSVSSAAAWPSVRSSAPSSSGSTPIGSGRSRCSQRATSGWVSCRSCSGTRQRSRLRSGSTWSCSRCRESPARRWGSGCSPRSNDSVPPACSAEWSAWPERSTHSLAPRVRCSPACWCRRVDLVVLLDVQSSIYLACGLLAYVFIRDGRTARLE